MDRKQIVLQSDFGLVDGAVAAMTGVIKKVDKKIEVYNLTHDIPQFDIFQASFRLYQTISYWPNNTVFVSVVDPGVGSVRKSVVVLLKDNKYIVSPNNGTFTHIAKYFEIVEVREIDESINRLPGSEKSHTFHGRDIFSYTAARLASKEISFKDIGPKINNSDLVKLELLDPIYRDGYVSGNINILDIRYGSLWTNIDQSIFEKANINFKDKLMVKISKYDRTYYNNIVTYNISFSDVNIGEPIVYINSVLTVALAINQGSFSKAYNIGTGIDWKIDFERMDK